MSENTKQHKGRIENWFVLGNKVFGNFHGHPDPTVLMDGEPGYTSAIVKLDREAKTVETANSIYTLGKEQVVPEVEAEPV